MSFLVMNVIVLEILSNILEELALTGSGNGFLCGL